MSDVSTVVPGAVVEAGAMLKAAFEAGYEAGYEEGYADAQDDDEDGDARARRLLVDLRFALEYPGRVPAGAALELVAGLERLR